MLVIGKAADPQTLDPAVTIDNNDWTVTYPAYQRLVKYKTDDGKGSTDVEGELAESWQVSDDGKTRTFTLHKSMQFADGSPVTAEAVKLSFERLMRIKQGPSEAFPSGLKIDAVDPPRSASPCRSLSPRSCTPSLTTARRSSTRRC